MKSICRSNHKLKSRGALICLCFFFLFSSNSFAGQRNDTLIQTHVNSIDPLNRTSISDNQFAFISAQSWDMKNRLMTIYLMDLFTTDLSEIKVAIPTNIKILQCPTFCLNDSFLIIQDEYELDWFLFKKVMGNFQYLEKINLPPKTKAFDARVIDQHTFLLTDVYNHHPTDSIFNTSLCIYDARLRKITSALHPEVPCIGLSHFPQNWISQNNTFIAMAEPCGNKIRLYNGQLQLIKTINLPVSKNWVNLPGNKLPIETSPASINPKSLIEDFTPLLSTFSRIETIHIANDSLLLISCNNPKVSNRHENYIYNLSGNKFISPTTVSFSEKGDHGDSSRAILSFEIDPYQMIRNGICISLKEDNFISNPSLTIEENENNKNIYFEENEPEFIVKVSQIKIK